MIPDVSLSQQFFPLLQPSTRQSMRLSAFLENSTLRRVLNFFLPSRQVSLQMLWKLVLTVDVRFISVGVDFATILFSSFLFLHPLRHRFGAASQAEILSAAKRAEMADVEQMKKMVPIITCEISFG